MAGASGLAHDSRPGLGLELQRVVKTYNDVPAVRGVDLAVTSGEFMTVLGPSGSGKTTILRLVSGFTELTSGRILLAGKDVSNVAPARRGIGMVFQNYALFPHLNVHENVAYGLKMREWSKSDRAARVAEMLELVGLSGMERRLPRELSGGQQQRVAVARALAFSPDLMLMDEPLGALDRELRFRMAGELRRIHAEFGTTVVYVTHDREEALTLSDRIAIMHDGRIEAVDTPMNLFHNPSSSFVASFFGGHNLVATDTVVSRTEASAAAASVSAFGQTMTVKCASALRAGEPVLVSVPVQAVGIEPFDTHSVEIDMTVVDALYMGELTRAMCRPVTQDAAGRLIQADITRGDVSSLRPGQTRRFYIDTSRCVAVQPTAAHHA